MMLAETTLRFPDYVILVGYFMIMLGIGAYFWRYMKNMRDYFSGRNQIPWWLSGVSFYMTSFSAFLFVAYSENAHQYGFVAVMLGWMVVPAVSLGAAVFASRWRRARIDSPVEYLEERYSLALRQVFGWANIPVRLIDNGLRLLATGAFVSVTLGVDLKTSIITSGLITLAYTFAGGLWAVTVTDFVQFVVMMAGAIVLVPLSLARIDGVHGFFGSMPPDTWKLTAGPYTWLYLLSWFLLLTCNYNQSFGLVQRYYCVRDEREAKKTALLVAGLCIIGTPIFFAPALAARQFMPAAESKHIYGILCGTLLPTGMLGLIIAAMFSATMSSLSGEYNVLASVLTNDVYKRLVNPRASDRKLVLIGRLMTVVVGLVPVAVAVFLVSAGGQRALFQQMVTVFSVAAPPIAIPMLLGLVWRKASNLGAIAGFGAGITTGLILFTLIQKGVITTTGKNHEIILTLSTVSTTLVAMVVISLLCPSSGEEKRRSEAFAQRLRRPVTGDEIAETGVIPSPWGVVGACMVAVAVMLLAITPFMKWDVGSIANVTVGGSLLAIGALMTIRAVRSARKMEKKS